MNRRFRNVAPLGGVLTLALLAACRNGAAGGSAPAATTAGTSEPAATTATTSGAPASVVVVEPIFDGGRKGEWQDWGWSRHDDVPGGPARLDLSNWGGWTLVRPNLTGAFGGLTFRVKAPRSFGDWLDVHVENPGKKDFPHLRPTAAQGKDAGDGWLEYFLPMSALDPNGEPFDRVIFFVSKALPSDLVSLDKIGLTRADGTSGGGASVAAGASRVVPTKMVVECRGKATKISPLIYGIAFDPQHDAKDKQQFEMGATARRWGGNPTSRYNWQIGNAWNTANDWYFENVTYTGPSWSYTQFLTANAAHGMRTALTVPMIGWVAKDTSSYAFPVSEYGPQESVDPWKNDAGNGKRKGGAKIAPGSPTRTSVAAPPEFVRRWVEAIRADDKRNGRRSVDEYILDNEPNLWSATHRDVHPEPVTYDELVDKTIQYGAAIRAADPDAVIAGPAEWGWTNYFFSGKDSTVGTRLKPDRLAHGDQELIAYYLKKLAEHERATGVRVLDVLDLHVYPQGDRLYGQNGAVDADGAARRIRATRALWDPSYVDESWIREPVRLLPRMKEWVAQNYPGRGISIGEWNFGGEGHISGALATAETLGRFAQYEVTSAYYWSYPAASSPAFWGFRAYTNFDGKFGRFQDNLVPSQAPAGSSLFASRDGAGGHYVLVALNLTPDATERATIALGGCAAPTSAASWVYSGGAAGFAPGKTKVDAGAVTVDLPPYSITVLDLRMPPG